MYTTHIIYTTDQSSYPVSYIHTLSYVRLHVLSVDIKHKLVFISQSTSISWFPRRPKLVQLYRVLHPGQRYINKWETRPHIKHWVHRLIHSPSRGSLQDCQSGIRWSLIGWCCLLYEFWIQIKRGGATHLHLILDKLQCIMGSWPMTVSLYIPNGRQIACR